MDITRTLIHREMPSIRGVLQQGFSNRVLLLINGMPSWKAETGDLCLSRIDIDDVEQIEILKGPASVLYGTNAYAGAINVVLKKEKSRTTHGHVAWQERGGYRLGANHTEKLGDMRLFISANGSLDRGKHRVVQAETGPSYTMNDYIRRRNANFLLEGYGLTVQANVFKEETPYFGVLNTLASGGGADWAESGSAFKVGYDYRPTETLGLKYAFVYDSSRTWMDSTPTRSDYSKIKGHRAIHSLNGSWSPMKSLSFELGGSLENRKNDYHDYLKYATNVVWNRTGMDDKSVKEDSIYAQVDFSYGPLNFLLGSRRTHNEYFGTDISSRLTSVYTLSPTSSIKLIFGESFRAPSMLETFSVLTSIKGNKDLDPEKSRSVEAAYLVNFGQFFFQALAYYSDFDGMTYRKKMQPTDTFLTYANGPKFSVKGAELEVRYRDTVGTNAFLNLDYMKGNNGDQLPGVNGYNYKMVPNFNARFGISKKFGPFSASVLGRYVAGNDGPLGPVDLAGKIWETVPSWAGADVSVSYTHNIQAVSFQHTFAAKNVTDKERWFSECMRRGVNKIPQMEGRTISYVLSGKF